MFKPGDRVWYDGRSAIVVGIDPHGMKARIRFDDTDLTLWRLMSFLDDEPPVWGDVDSSGRYVTITYGIDL